MSTKNINRLILVGNGFDLAHGLQTSYNDFLLGYLKKVCLTASKGSGFSDDLLTIDTISNFNSCYGNLYTLEEIVQRFFESDLAVLLSNDTVIRKPWDNSLVSNPFRFHLKPLINKLLHSCKDKSWVGIEFEYYDALMAILKMDTPHDPLVRLQAGFANLITELGDYLKNLPPPPKIKSYEDLIVKPILGREISSYIGKELDVINPKEYLILNFNYTTTIEQYANEITKRGHILKLNNIHGSLNEPNNPLIFGFGDEKDQNFSLLESNRNNKFLTYIKSFPYLKTNNYHKLIRFIDSAPFQVLTLGHSCGLSDRTMLSMIFEHENCLSVKLCYHGTAKENNYTTLAQDISRHFNDKLQFRRKMVNARYCEAMPQL